MKMRPFFILGWFKLRSPHSLPVISMGDETTLRCVQDMVTANNSAYLLPQIAAYAHGLEYKLCGESMSEERFESLMEANTETDLSPSPGGEGLG